MQCIYAVLAKQGLMNVYFLMCVVICGPRGIRVNRGSHISVKYQVYKVLALLNPYSAGIVRILRPQTSDSVRVNIFLMAVDP